jgi:citrate lyase subunit beta / citryl-CoA lyase
MITGLRRSGLYVPGDSRKMIEKSASVPADVILFNLEDGVARSRKDEARRNVCQAVVTSDFVSREIVIRINSLESEIGKCDLAEAVACRPDGICIPKVERAADVRAADIAMLEIEIAHGMLEGGTKLHAMIESAAGVMNAAEIALASPRMSSLVFGSADYAKDVRCQPGEDRTEILLALQMVVTSARAAGIDALDAPCFDLRNPDLLRREAVQARRLGYDGKSAIHPGQVAPINEVFDVTPEEVAWAEQVLAGLAEAENQGRGVSTLGNRLIEDPHRVAAIRILERRNLASRA